MPYMEDVVFFVTPAEFRAWLTERRATAAALWVGFYKKGSGRPSITWPEAVDEALGVGWLGRLRKSVDGAVLLFEGDSPAVAEQLVAADPYVRNGLVTSWRIRPWATVAGDAATSPVRPAAAGATGGPS